MDCRRSRSDRNTGNGCSDGRREDDLFESAHCFPPHVRALRDQAPTLLASIMKRNGTVPLMSAAEFTAPAIDADYRADREQQFDLAPSWALNRSRQIRRSEP